MSNAAKIAELRAEADKLEAADKAFRELAPEYRLAITLHEMMCHHNHIDGCGWEYESTCGKPDWFGYAHSTYLGKARNLFTFCCNHNIGVDDAVEMLKLVQR